MAIHGNNVWDYALAAAEKLDYKDELNALEEAGALLETERRWRVEDPFVELMKEGWRRQTRRRGGLMAIIEKLREDREEDEKNATPH